MSIKTRTYEFNTDGKCTPIDIVITENFQIVYADNKNLIELTLCEGMTHVFCQGNHLKELKIPSSIIRIRCDKDLFNYDECKVNKVHIYYE